MHHKTYTKLKNTKSDNNKSYEDLPEEYRKLIGGDFEHTHMVKGLDWNLLRQTKDKIARQEIQDIENAFNDTNSIKSSTTFTSSITDYTTTTNNDNTTEIQNDNDDGDNDDGDISMLMDIKSIWAYNIHKTVSTHFSMNAIEKEKQKAIKINPKFCNGMMYKFDISDESKTSIPTEVMRSNVAYGMVLDEFNEFEDDNFDDKLCLGFTPSNVIDLIKDSLNNHKNGTKSKIEKKTVDNDTMDIPMKDNNTNQHNENNKNETLNTNRKGIKRKFSEMNESSSSDTIDSNKDKDALTDNNRNDEDDDFDIFADVGRDYVCDPDLPSKDPKRRRVAFAEPTTEKINKMKESYFGINKDALRNSSVKTAAASILKSSLNKAKIENLKLKRQMAVHQESIIPDVMPSLERNNNTNNNSNNNKNDKKKTDIGHSLRGKLLSSGFATYDDDDYDGMRGYNSDDDDAAKKVVSAANADAEWKKIQNKYADKEAVSKSVKEKLQNANANA